MNMRLSTPFFPLWRALPAALVAMLVLAAPAGAIVIRHDRDDARYLELGARFPAVCKVGRQMGDGTLVGPRHILTAAHVARGLVGRGEPVVICDDEEFRVAEVFIHPDWVDMGPHDVAIVRLDAAVEGIAPLALYEASDEAGREAVMVGHGATGTGDSRNRSEDGLRRGATNVIEEANDRHLRFRFDAPPDGTHLEGIPGAGDSGGPAIITVDGVDYVAGVSSLGEPGSNGPGTYGANDYFVRVSTHADWIQSALAGREVAYRAPAAAIPASAAGARLAALADLVAAGSSADVARFVQDNMVPAADAVERRVEALTRLVTDFAGASFRRVVDQADDRVVAAYDTGDGVQLLGVEIEAGAPHRITAVIRGRM